MEGGLARGGCMCRAVQVGVCHFTEGRRGRKDGRRGGRVEMVTVVVVVVAALIAVAGGSTDG
jgi:hypothetical protein